MQARMLPDGRRLHLNDGPIDLVIGAVGRADEVLRAYRLYLAGCALGFEQGWLALHQVLASRPDGLAGAQSDYPFQRGYMYPAS